MNARAVLKSLIKPVDARVPAIFRIAIGLVATLDFADRLRDAFTFYSGQGLLAPDTGTGSMGLLPSVLLGASASPARVMIFFVFGFAALTCFTLGYRTRLAAVLTWIAVFTIQMRNRTICDGGDTLLRILCFWALFIDLGGRLSLDVWLGRRPAQNTVPGLPVRLLRLQLALVYLTAGLSKSGASWMDGSAVYYAVQSMDFGRPLGVWLAGHPMLARAVAFSTVVIEVAFAPLVLVPLRTTAARAVGLALGLALHVGIALTMRVGIFSWVLPASYTIFLAPQWIDAALRRVRARAAPVVPLTTDGAALDTNVTRRSALFWGALSLQMAAVVCQLILGKGGGHRAPPVYRELAALGLSQTWTMFSPEPPRRLNRFTANGVGTDGAQIDVLARAAPLLSPDHALFYSRWFKYRSDLARAEPADLAAFGRYLCRRYNGETTGAKLERFTLTLYWRDIPPPGGASVTVAPWQQADVLQQPCLSAAP
ncbi:MAG: hypothetical protein QOI66_2548 [Myxococcales bacterium]|jgi:hypothetical protein|nr:hypothetical protein [Myxococcales bacterium]